MKIRSFIFCVVGVLVLCGEAKAGTLYAATAGTHGELYILDPATSGVLRDVGPLNDAAGRNYPLTGLAFHPRTGVLYGSTHDSPTADPATVLRLVTIDPETAEATVVGPFYLGNPGTMTDLAFYHSGQLVGNILYGPNVAPGSPPQTSLVRINTRTGAVTDIGRSVDSLEAIAFIPEPASWLLAALVSVGIFFITQRRHCRPEK